MAFEEVDFRRPKKWWGVFMADDTTPSPIAIFRDETHAHRFIDWLANEAPEDERINVDMTVGEIVGFDKANEAEPPPIQVWNSIEPMPERKS